jgi:dihydroorotase-like cyclic amidohydrolase
VELAFQVNHLTRLQWAFDILLNEYADIVVFMFNWVIQESMFQSSVENSSF